MRSGQVHREPLAAPESANDPQRSQHCLAATDVGTSVRFAHEYEDHACAEEFTACLRHIDLTLCDRGATTEGESADVHTEGWAAVAA
jgi:hypothetical protein